MHQAAPGPMKMLISMIDVNVKPGWQLKKKDIRYCEHIMNLFNSNISEYIYANEISLSSMDILKELYIC